MNITILRKYMRLCKALNIEETVEGLHRFKRLLDKEKDYFFK